MLSRITEALKRMNVVTLEQLSVRSFTIPTCRLPSLYTERIFSTLKIGFVTCSLKNHSYPCRFKLNELGEVGMTHWNWAVAKKKEWEGPYVVLRQLPQDNLSVQLPDNLPCPSIEAMQAALKHVLVRMTPKVVAWWQRFLEDEKERQKQSDEMADEDYQEAGSTFDLMQMKYNDEAHNEREEELFTLFEKNYKFLKVSYLDLQ